MINLNSSNFNQYLNNNIQSSEDLHITTREMQVLRHVVLGLSAKRIGRSMNISHRTVEKYIENLKNKFKCDSKSSLLYRCIHNVTIRDQLFI